MRPTLALLAAVLIAACGQGPTDCGSARAWCGTDGRMYSCSGEPDASAGVFEDCIAEGKSCGATDCASLGYPDAGSCIACR